MSQLVWKSEYSIGHFQIDHEHKALISLANKVISFSNIREGSDRIQGALKALSDYTLIHFRNEEDYMERIGYPEIAHHKQCHAELIARMNTVINHNAGLADLVHGLKRLMVFWVIEHMINEDQRIAPGK